MLLGVGVSSDFKDGVFVFKFMYVHSFPRYFSAVLPHPEATADRKLRSNIYWTIKGAFYYWGRVEGLR